MLDKGNGVWLGVRLERDGTSPAWDLVSCCENQTQGKGEWLEGSKNQSCGLIVWGCAMREIFCFPNSARSQCLPFIEGMCWEAHESGLYQPLSSWWLEKQEKYLGTAAPTAPLMEVAFTHVPSFIPQKPLRIPAVSEGGEKGQRCLAYHPALL